MKPRTRTVKVRFSSSRKWVLWPSLIKTLRAKNGDKKLLLKKRGLAGQVQNPHISKLANN